jgi:hypothetical protein
MQWVLAYDGACGRCRALAERVVALGAGRLVARSLRDPEVAAWRERLVGPGRRGSRCSLRWRGRERSGH